MSGISLKEPLIHSESDGYYTLTQTLKETVQQNLKMLLLTIPGERVMIPDFGVGIPQYLFENKTPKLESEISSNIRKQVHRYMPFISIQTLFLEPDEGLGTERGNSLKIVLEYYIEPIAESDILSISLPN